MGVAYLVFVDCVGIEIDRVQRQFVRLARVIAGVASHLECTGRDGDHFDGGRRFQRGFGVAVGVAVESVVAVGVAVESVVAVAVGVGVCGRLPGAPTLRPVLGKKTLLGPSSSAANVGTTATHTTVSTTNTGAIAAIQTVRHSAFIGSSLRNVGTYCCPHAAGNVQRGSAGQRIHRYDASIFPYDARKARHTRSGVKGRLRMRTPVAS